MDVMKRKSKALRRTLWTLAFLLGGSIVWVITVGFVPFRSHWFWTDADLTTETWHELGYLDAVVTDGSNTVLKVASGWVNLGPTTAHPSYDELYWMVPAGRSSATYTNTDTGFVYDGFSGYSPWIVDSNTASRAEVKIRWQCGPFLIAAVSATTQVMHPGKFVPAPDWQRRAIERKGTLLFVRSPSPREQKTEASNQALHGTAESRADAAPSVP